ncbi:hypothetical protein FFF34_008880 [Inquilinus sp. KBS0705]|nr:hypothetical protein FFF34_008880 [Inquilinus sp. KBS0705]
MKKDIVKLLALLFLGAAALSGCAIDNYGHHRRGYDNRYRHDRNYDRDHDRGYGHDRYNDSRGY